MRSLCWLKRDTRSMTSTEAGQVIAFLDSIRGRAREKCFIDAFCADLGRLLVASRPAEGYDEGPGAPKSR